MNASYDVIVIGSGAGGAPIAYTLAKQNKSVLVLEKGPLIKPQNGTLSTFKRDELISDGPEQIIKVKQVANQGEPFYASHVEPDLNDEPHIYKDAGSGKDKVTIEGYTAQVVGGGTNLYGAVSLRFTPTDLKLQSFNEGRTLPTDPNGDIKRETRDWPISYDDLRPYYEKAEQLMGLNGTADNQVKPFAGKNFYQTPLSPNPISKFAYDGMVKMGQQLNPSNPIKPYRTPLAVITEDHVPSGRKVPANPERIKTSYVNRYGDPMGYKSSTWVSLLATVEALPNFTLLPNCTVTHLSAENSNVTRVNFRDPAGKMRTVEGKIIVVACSAIESVRLLQISALMDQKFNQRINHNGLLGKYFLTHAFGGASGLIPDGARADKSIALDSDWATDCCNTDDFLRDNNLWAGATIYNNTSDAALPISLFRTMGAMDLDTLWHGLNNDLSLRGQGLIDYLDREFGRKISLSFMANQVPQYNNRIELHPTIKDKWNRPVAYVNKTWHAHDMYLMDLLAEQCRKIFELGGVQVLGAGGSYQAVNGMVRIANHILGGARFGSDENDSVLDKNCRAWRFDNLYVTDGCFMPTSGSGNPTHTIEANSFRVADEIVNVI